MFKSEGEAVREVKSGRERERERESESERERAERGMKGRHGVKTS